MEKLYEEEIFLISFLKENFGNIFDNSINKIKIDNVNKFL
jgi:hypothetical protein